MIQDITDHGEPDFTGYPTDRGVCRSQYLSVLQNVLADRAAIVGEDGTIVVTDEHDPRVETRNQLEQFNEKTPVVYDNPLWCDADGNALEPISGVAPYGFGDPSIIAGPSGMVRSFDANHAALSTLRYTKGFTLGSGSRAYLNSMLGNHEWDFFPPATMVPGPTFPRSAWKIPTSGPPYGLPEVRPPRYPYDIHEVMDNAVNFTNDRNSAALAVPFSLGTTIYGTQGPFCDRMQYRFVATSLRNVAYLFTAFDGYLSIEYKIRASDVTFSDEMKWYAHIKIGTLPDNHYVDHADIRDDTYLFNRVPGWSFDGVYYSKSLSNHPVLANSAYQFFSVTIDTWFENMNPVNWLPHNDAEAGLSPQLVDRTPPYPLLSDISTASFGASCFVEIAFHKL